jgi:hypothetical protein
LLVRAARLIAASLGAYCVVDLVELEPRRVEIAHADLSHVERLREATRSASPRAVQRLLELAAPGEPKLVTSKCALAALELDFVIGNVGMCLVLPIVVGGELHAVLTLVSARSELASSESALLADAAAWIALGLERASAQKIRASEFPASTRSRSA